MKFYTAYYRQPGEEGVSLLVQQAIVGRKKHRVLFACIWEELPEEKGRGREEIQDIFDCFWQKILSETENFRWKVLGTYGLLKRIKKDMELLVNGMKWDSLAGILCVDENAIVMQRGNMKICLLEKRFLRPRLEVLEIVDDVMVLETGGRILLATEDFWQGLTNQMWAECLLKEQIRNEKQLIRRMEDLGKNIEVLEPDKQLAAILVCSEEDLQD